MSRQDTESLDRKIQAIAERFQLAMRRTASGVAIVTTDGAAGKGGATVSSFTSVSFSPPSVLVCLNKNSTTLTRLLENGVFAANILAEDQTDMADIFSGRLSMEERFLRGVWTILESGAPVLHEAVAHFDCRLAAHFDYGTHSIVIGDALDVALHDARPLAYSHQAYHRLHKK